MKNRLFALLAVTLIGFASAATFTQAGTTTPGAQTEGRAYFWGG